MLGGDETTDDPVVADTRNFYKVELWTLIAAVKAGLPFSVKGGGHWSIRQSSVPDLVAR